MRNSFSDKQVSYCRAQQLAFALLAFALATTPAPGAFHLWNIQEIYSDSSGTLQFIELQSSDPGQNFVNGLNVTVTSGRPSHTITLPGDPLPGDTTGHSLLFGTAGLHAAGGPIPDYIIPDNFLFIGGGNLNFFSAFFGTYTALPTDGVLSRTFGDGNAPNSPQNYAGQTGFVIPAPEPASSVLLGLGGFAALVARRRIVAKSGHR